MPSNIDLLEFLKNYGLVVALFLTSLLNIIPSKIIRSPQIAAREPRMSFLTFVLEGVADSISRSCFPLLAAFGLKNMITLILFTVVTFEMAIRKEISPQAVTLITVGILTLYLEELIKTGKKINFFGIVSWERRDDSAAQSRD